MLFVWMKHPEIEKAAEIPETAISHYESLGWERVDPPEKPKRATRAPAAEPTTAEDANAPAEQDPPASAAAEDEPAVPVEQPAAQPARRTSQK